MKTIKIDLAGPQYVISAEDPRQKEMTPRQISMLLFEVLVGAKHPQGMDGKDGRIWARFLDAFAADSGMVEVADDDFLWLHKVMTDDGLRIVAGLAHWRQALARYVDDLYHELRRAPADA